MAPIATYVFFDLGTTGLLETNPEITELHMIAIKCADLRRYFRDGGEEHFAKPPRQRPLHCRPSEDDVMMIMSSENDKECSLEDKAAAFLEKLEKPLCLIAHNGNKFDFPLLISKLADVEGFSLKNIVCADSMAAFYDIYEPDSEKTSYIERKKGSFPWPDHHYDRKSYRLEAIFKRVWNVWPNLEDAKDRNQALVNIAMGEGFQFMLWVAENNRPFASFIE